MTSQQISVHSRHIPLYKHNSLKLKHLTVTEKLKVSKFQKFNHGWWRSSPVQGPSLVKVQGWRPHGKINIGCPSFSPLLFSVTFCGIQFTREVCLPIRAASMQNFLTTFSLSYRSSRKNWPRWGWRTRGSATRSGASTEGSSRPSGKTGNTSWAGQQKKRNCSWATKIYWQ